MEKFFQGVFKFIDNKFNKGPEEIDEDRPDHLFERIQPKTKKEFEEGNGNEKVPIKDMIYDMKFTVPSFVQHDANEILSKPKFLKAYIQGYEDEFLGAGNFQLSYMGEVPGILWNFEKSRELGEMVLFFPNPDFGYDPKKEYEDNGIDLPTALQYFFEVFSSYHEYPGKKTFMANLEKIFVDTFLQLDEFENPEQKKKKEKLRKNQAERKMPVPNKEQPSEGPGPTGATTALPQVPELLFLKPDRDISPGRKGSSPTNSKKNNSKGGSLKNNISTMAQKRFTHTGSEIGEGGEQGPMMGFGQGNDAEVDIEAEKKKFRKVYGGGMYKLGGGLDSMAGIITTLVTDENQEATKKTDKYETHYARVDPVTKDFLTLIRKCIFAVLANQGFVLRSFFFPEGDKIAVVANLIPNNFHAIAKEIGIKKEVNFAMVDLMSMEPVDSELRPLRLHSILMDEQAWELQYGMNSKGSEKEAIMSLRDEINDMLHNQIKFKTVVRSIQGVWQETEADASKIFDSGVISLEVWRAYLVFLKSFHMRYTEISQLKEIVSKMIDDSHDETLIKIRNNANRSRSDKIELDKFVSLWLYQAFVRSLEDSNLSASERKELSQILLKNTPSKEELDYFNELDNPGDIDEDNRMKVDAKEKEEKRKKRLEEITDHMNELRSKRELDRYHFFENRKKKNKKFQKKLMKNIWDDIGRSPQHYYLDYDNGNNRMRPRKRDFFQKLWVDETNPYTLLSERFNNMERLKLVNYAVYSSLNSWSTR